MSQIFDDFKRECWGKAYLTMSEDPHQDFADLLGITRQEAKELCFRIISKSRLLSNVFKQVYK
jgi:hypothetical protein